MEGGKVKKRCGEESLGREMKRWGKRPRGMYGRRQRQSWGRWGRGLMRGSGRSWAKVWKEVGQEMGRWEGGAGEVGKNSKTGVRREVAETSMSVTGILIDAEIVWWKG